MSRREHPADPAAEAQRAAEKLRKLEELRAKARVRAKRSYERRKKAKRGPSLQTSAPPHEEASGDAAAAVRSKGGLDEVLAVDEANPPAETQPTPEELAAQQMLEQFGSAEKVAAFLARMQKVAEIAASKSPRASKVVEALDWANADGSSTDACRMGVELAWPWLSAGGVEWLALMGPGFMAACGALVLFGPAAIVAWDELEAHRAERKRLAEKGDADKKDQAAKTPEARA